MCMSFQEEIPDIISSFENPQKFKAITPLRVSYLAFLP